MDVCTRGTDRAAATIRARCAIAERQGNPQGSSGGGDDWNEGRRCEGFGMWKLKLVARVSHQSDRQTDGPLTQARNRHARERVNEGGSEEGGSAFGKPGWASVRSRFVENRNGRKSVNASLPACLPARLLIHMSNRPQDDYVLCVCCSCSF